MAKLTTDQLIEAFKELSLIELSEFVKKFEEVFEVTAAAPVAVAAAPAAGGAAAEEVEEKTSFDVVLEAAGDKKIQVIKEVRALTSLGLGEAKAVVDGAPGVVLEGVNKETADKAKAQLEEAGATVTPQVVTRNIFESPARRESVRGSRASWLDRGVAAYCRTRANRECRGQQEVLVERRR